MNSKLANNPPPDTFTVRLLIADTALPELVGMFCRAFDRDAHINWLVRQDAGRTKAMYNLFRLLLSPNMGGELHTTTDGNGAALWFAPGSWHMGWLKQTVFFMHFLGIAGWPRALSRGLGMKHMKTSHPDRPHFYLQLLGVEPEHQAQGHGGALLAALLTRCDQAMLPAYLETSSENNVSFYAHRGFSIVAENHFPDGLILWSMLREPAALIDKPLREPQA